MYSHLFIPLNLWIFKIRAYYNFEFLFESMHIVPHVKLLTWTKVSKGVTLMICWIRTSQEKVKHHNRWLNFKFYMRNKKIKIICATSRVIFRPLPFCKLPHFSESSLPGVWSTLSTTVKHLQSDLQWFRGASDLNYSAHTGCYCPMHELCLCWSLRLELSSTIPAPGITVPLTSPAAEMT